MGWSCINEEMLTDSITTYKFIVIVITLSLYQLARRNPTRRNVTQQQQQAHCLSRPYPLKILTRSPTVYAVDPSSPVKVASVASVLAVEPVVS
eukprot:COSAG06_NODE_899_length_11665_cov_50.453052_11_plen_93_part_00